MNGDDNFRLQKKKSFRVRIPGQRRMRSVVESNTVEDLTGMSEVDTLEICKTCGTIIHDIKDAAAVCGVCGDPLCRVCANNTCALCGKALCEEDTVLDRKGRKFCSNHRFFDRHFSRKARVRLK